MRRLNVTSARVEDARVGNFLVRGAPKCLAVLTLFALAHNVMRAIALLAPAA